MPTTLIAVSLVGSLLALIVGILLGWQGLLSNVAANLVILGPGLLVTNVLVGIWRENKLAASIEPWIRVVLHGLLRFHSPVLELSNKLQLHIELDSSIEGDLKDLNRVYDFLKLIHGQLDTATSGDPSRLPQTIALNEAIVDIPSMQLLERLMGHLNSQRPMPDAYMLASMLSHAYSGQYYFHTVHRIVTDGSGEGVYSPKIGMDSLRSHMLECELRKDDIVAWLEVDTQQYIEFISTLTERSAMMLKYLKEALPTVLLLKLDP